MTLRRVKSFVPALLLLLLAVPALSGQRAQTGTPYTILSSSGRRPLAAAAVHGHEMFALDDLAAAFQLSVHADTLGAITVSYKNKTIVLTPDQNLASVNGRIVSLPAAPAKVGGQWFVPVEFLSRALAPIYDAPLDVRTDSRLIVTGAVVVPRVTVRFDAAGGGGRVTLDVQPRVPETVTHTGRQLLVKFQATALDPVLSALPPQELVQGFAVVPPSTLAIALGPQFSSFSVATQSTGESTGQVVITIVSAGSQTSPGTPPPQVPQGQQGQQGQPAAPAIPPGQPLPSLGGAPQPALQTIVIDPGHGGSDQGVQGPHGTLEKNLTMAVARRLKSAIEGRLGIRVLLTRDGDQTLSADERAALANNNKADLFLSLHANASFRSTAQGAEILFLGLDRDAAQASEQASAGAQQLPVLGGGSRQVEIVPWQFAQTRFIDQSKTFAGMIAHQFEGHVPLDGRGVTQAPLRVLVGANMPAVLVEMGYLSNASQENQLGTATFQNTVVQAIYAAIVQFRDWLPQRRSDGTTGGGGAR